MKKTSEVTACVVDHGLFLPVARRLARDFQKVYYYTPADCAFPKVQNCLGDGFDDIERVECPWCVKDEVDLYVFPDIGFGQLQVELQNRGFHVWGHLGGDALEVNRGLFLDTLKKIGLSVPKYEKVKGITNLRLSLQGVQDRWIKISKFRGDFETFHWRSEEEDGNTLDVYAAQFGPFRELVTFYVFDPIEAEIEDGCDAWCVEGQFPEVVIHGVEQKDRAYIGTFQRYKDVPEQVRHVTDAFGPVLKQYGYRSFFSCEVRITDDNECFFIDPTCRCGSPPSQVMSEMIANYGEVIWKGANGVLVNPEDAAKFGAQALCKFNRDRDSWTYVKLGGDLDRWVKSAHAIGSGRMLALPPGDYQTGCEDWITGIGDTLSEAIRHLMYNADQLPDGCSCDCESLGEVLKEITEAEEKGMEFTDQPVPPPEIVLES